MLSVVAGVFSKLNQVSLSLVLVPGLLGFTGLVALEPNDVLLILIATSLCASLPFSVLYFIDAAKESAVEISDLTRTATKIALLCVLGAQILTIVPAIYVFYFYWGGVLVYAISFIFVISMSQVQQGAFLRLKKQSSAVYYLGLLSVVMGGTGVEWRNVLAKCSKSKSVLAGFGIISIFITLPACLGFIIPALPVSLLEQYPSFSSWMLGYIFWPLSIVIFVSALAGHWLVRQHDNLTDVAWLNCILVIYLIASALRLLIP